MTTRWRPEFDPNHLYFVTTSTVNHAHILKREIVKRILVDALYYVSLMGRASLYAFVIMPNHIHVIAQYPEDVPPKDWVRADKTSTSQLIVRLYEVEHNLRALEMLAAAVTRPDKQEYKVWEDGYWSESIFTPDFVEQKLTYLHNNPL